MSYYRKRLSGARLRECYEIAPARVKQYLEAEIDFVRSRLRSGQAALELGCGYGRVALELARSVRRMVGIDISEDSLSLARELAGPGSNCEFLQMDATDLRFDGRPFDATLCVQNGICAFGTDPLRLLREALRVTRTGGRVLFSSYCEAFWPHRLEWFEIQSRRGLVGPIDYARTGAGVIACEDGFRAGTMSRADFEVLCARAGLVPTLTEVDHSSLFCEAVIPATLPTSAGG